MSRLACRPPAFLLLLNSGVPAQVAWQQAMDDDDDGWRAAAGEVLHLAAERLGTERTRQTVTTALVYRHERDGRVAATERQLFVLRWWTVEEITAALRGAGFERVVVSGGYRFGQTPAVGEVVTLEAVRSQVDAGLAKPVHRPQVAGIGQ